MLEDIAREYEKNQIRKQKPEIRDKSDMGSTPACFNQNRKGLWGKDAKDIRKGRKAMMRDDPKRIRLMDQPNVSDQLDHDSSGPTADMTCRDQSYHSSLLHLNLVQIEMDDGRLETVFVPSHHAKALHIAPG
ncbi:hypothetical protein RRG08_022039 [Elysia crispata]|uniref:Uncharacterized protein n=1 Tax=Elysia crispata TaxID=231223 RepID=A0AAE0YXQ8_9GAST|nr:hypothetical protein RRG08_022039 [Elysia crispata]